MDAKFEPNHITITRNNIFSAFLLALSWPHTNIFWNMLQVHNEK